MQPIPKSSLRPRAKIALKPKPSVPRPSCRPDIELKPSLSFLRPSKAPRLVEQLKEKEKLQEQKELEEQEEFEEKLERGAERHVFKTRDDPPHSAFASSHTPYLMSEKRLPYKSKGKVVLPDAPPESAAHLYIRLGKASAFFVYNGVNGKEKLSVSFKACGDDTNLAAKIARLCYRQFEEGATRKEVKPYRDNILQNIEFHWRQQAQKNKNADCIDAHKPVLSASTIKSGGQGVATSSREHLIAVDSDEALASHGETGGSGWCLFEHTAAVGDQDIQHDWWKRADTW